MINELNDKTSDDPLLKLFNILLDEDEEKRILSMIFNGHDHKDILETLINYSSEGTTDD